MKSHDFYSWESKGTGANAPHPKKNMAFLRDDEFHHDP